MHVCNMGNAQVCIYLLIFAEELNDRLITKFKWLGEKQNSFCSRKQIRKRCTFFSFPTCPPLPIHLNYDLLQGVILGNSTEKCLDPMGLAMSLILCRYTLGSGWEKLVSPKY